MLILPASLRHASQTAKSAALVLFGLAGLARAQMAGQGAVLTFHGLRADGVSTGVGDESLHLPVSAFRAICTHLAECCRVLPLAEMAAVLQAGEKLPTGAVAITFDDGYASNYELGYPILRELGLHATIFLATGFLDGTHPLWFQEVDRALGGPSAVGLGETLARLKSLPDEKMRAEVREMAEPCEVSQTPAVTRPLTWGQVREMSASGLIELGGHTHTHPILARCSWENQRWEIGMCRDRITTELGRAPRLFAYPNGGMGDFTADTQLLLAESGFTSAWTMITARASQDSASFEMPRYGSPESVWETEATVSGAFELVRKWKGGGA